ncbi:MAG: hypothetical protein M3252_03370 [Actinomycetota bacterium]|nr:hypothetical protein [Actinomycetota bacterium]
MTKAALLDRALRAAGGLEAWRAARVWEARLSTGGLAFRARGRADLHDVRASVATWGQRVVLDPFPKPGHRASWHAGMVRIERSSGGLVEEQHVTNWGRRWDDLSMAAFVGLALWTYASLPFVLADDDIVVEASGDRRLFVRFPDTIRTHSQIQTLHLDDRGLIRRHDYTALAFGRWARAAQHVFRYEWCGAIRVPLERRVVPRVGTSAMPGPTLVWIRVSDVGLH